MTAQPVEPLPEPVPHDRAEQSAVISAGVIDRLRREGQPVPGIDIDPAP